MDLYVALLEDVEKQRMALTHYTSLCFQVTIKSCWSVNGYHERREVNEYISVLATRLGQHEAPVRLHNYTGMSPNV